MSSRNQADREPQPASQRTSHHAEEFKADLINRLSKIEGQIRGTKRLIEGNTYCDDVLNVLASAQAALDSVRTKLLERHIESCVAEQLRNGESKVIGELMKTIRRMMK
jgi:DNA-binding FrmR family transcriptional regulator